MTFRDIRTPEDWNAYWKQAHMDTREFLRLVSDSFMGTHHTASVLVLGAEPITWEDRARL